MNAGPHRFEECVLHFKGALLLKRQALAIVDLPDKLKGCLQLGILVCRKQQKNHCHIANNADAVNLMANTTEYFMQAHVPK